MQKATKLLRQEKVAVATGIVTSNVALGVRDMFDTAKVPLIISNAGANALTVSNFDPVSRQPELKHAAIEVKKLDLPHRIVAMRRFARIGQVTVVCGTATHESSQSMLGFGVAKCRLAGIAP